MTPHAMVAMLLRPASRHWTGWQELSYFQSRPCAGKSVPNVPALREGIVFDTVRQGIWTLVRPVGELDLAVADEFRATILEALVEGGTDHLAIDFSDVTFLDSTGLNVIATALKETRSRGGRLVLVGP